MQANYPLYINNSKASKNDRELLCKQIEKKENVKFYGKVVDNQTALCAITNY